MTTATIDDVREAFTGLVDRDTAERVIYRLRVERGLVLATGRPGYDLALGATRDVVATDFAPIDCARVAATLFGLLSREPMKSGRGYSFERLLLGALYSDLEGIAAAAGEPTGARRDMRDARCRQDELAAQARMDLAERGYTVAVTEAIESDRASFAAAQDPEPEPATPPMPDWM